MIYRFGLTIGFVLRILFCFDGSLRFLGCFCFRLNAVVIVILFFNMFLRFEFIVCLLGVSYLLV